MFPKVNSTDGLILWFDGGVTDFVSLALEHGNLVLRYADRSEEVVVIYHSDLNDNLWHRVRAVR